MVNKAVVGKIGTVCYGLFSFLCLLRTVQIWRVIKNLRQLKFLFHIALTSCALFDLGYSISLLSDNYLIWGYILHLLAGYFFLLAYTLVLYLWGKTFRQNAEFSNRACITIGVLNLVCTIVAIGALCDSDNMNTYGTKYGLINVTLLVVYSLSFVVLTSSMIWFGVSLLRQLQASVLLFRPSATRPPRPPLSPSSSMSARLTGVTSGVERGEDQGRQDTRKRIAIIIRVNMVLMGCNLCFSLRVLALFTLAVYTVLGEIENLPIGIAVWFLLSNWIPTLVPGCILLYIMRVKPPQRMKWRVDLSSLPSGIENQLPPESVQSSFRDSRPRSTSHFASAQQPRLFQETTSSIPGDESAKSSGEINSQDDNSSDEELIIHEEILLRASADSFQRHDLRSFG